MSQKEDWKFLLVLVLTGGGLFELLSMAWPVGPGVDFQAYLYSYWRLTPESVLFRAVGAATLIGWLAEAGLVWMHVILLSSYLLTIVAVHRIGCFYSPMVARTVTFLYVLHVQVSHRLHHLDADSLLIPAMILWVLTVLTTERLRHVAATLIPGVMVAAMAAIKPNMVIFGISAIYPVVCDGWNRRNLLRVLYFLIGFGCGIGGLLGYNHSVSGQWLLVADANHLFPGFNVFMVNPMLSREQGPENRTLYALVEQQVLSRKPYVELGITADQFFTAQDPRMWPDLEYVDWVHAPGIIKRASWEAIAAQPKRFLIWSVLSGHYRTLTHSHIVPLESKTAYGANSGQASTPAESGGPTSSVASTPTPTAQIRIPYSFSSTREMLSFYGGPRSTKDEERIAAIREKVKKRILDLTTSVNRERAFYPALLTNDLLSRLVPPMLFFALLATGLLIRIKHKEIRLLICLLMPALGVVFSSALLRPQARYRLPFDFLLILSGVIALIGTSSTPMKKVRHDPA
ncbi:MAG: hypothetical protein HQL99_15910 [Magnetococcales bacterium]|nr:hypothetical protein [Magnetococcales bacterium]